MSQEKFEYEYSYAFNEIPEAKLRGTLVTVPPKDGRNNSIEKALRLFKRRVKDSGKIDELKDRQEFIKPSAVRRREMSTAIRRQQKQLEFADENEQI